MDIDFKATHVVIGVSYGGSLNLNFYAVSRQRVNKTMEFFLNPNAQYLQCVLFCIAICYNREYSDPPDQMHVSHVEKNNVEQSSTVQIVNL